MYRPTREKNVPSEVFTVPWSRLFCELQYRNVRWTQSYTRNISTKEGVALDLPLRKTAVF